jgi:hypothetical protein
MTKIVNRLDDQQLEDYRETFYKNIEGWEVVFKKNNFSYNKFK